MKALNVTFLFFGLMLSVCAANAEQISLDKALTTLIKQSKYEASKNGIDLWKDFDKAPKGLLLTLPDKEVLFCHGSHVDGFRHYQISDELKCDAQERTSQFPKNLLAAMPIAQGKSTIVMGTPDSTGLDPASWIHTVFHEHFHQYQSILPDYYQRVDGLALSNGDNTGMWMINYAFPYKDGAFNEQYKKAAEQLLNLIQDDDITDSEFSAYLEAREALANKVSDDDWRYFEFQLWQEGIARWHEIKMASRSRYDTVVDAGNLLKESTLKNLIEQTPSMVGRISVYAFGAAEGMLLDRCSVDWREGYITTLDTGSLIKEIVPSNCD